MTLTASGLTVINLIPQHTDDCSTRCGECHSRPCLWNLSHVKVASEQSLDHRERLIRRLSLRRQGQGKQFLGRWDMPSWGSVKMTVKRHLQCVHQSILSLSRNLFARHCMLQAIAEKDTWCANAIYETNMRDICLSSPMPHRHSEAGYPTLRAIALMRYGCTVSSPSHSELLIAWRTNSCLTNPQTSGWSRLTCIFQLNLLWRFMNFESRLLQISTKHQHKRND